MSEIWLPISGYEGLYEVSNMGRVRSYKNNRWGLRENPVIMRGQRGKHYITVCLCSDTKETHAVHKLVAEAFLGVPNEPKEVNHIDGNKLNNAVSNLEWVSHRENIRHARDTDLFGSQRRVVCVETGAKYASETKAAEAFGVTQASISRAITRGRKCCGLHWKFDEGEI